MAGTALAVAARALAESPGGEVAGVGIAGMAETGVLLDRARRAGRSGRSPGTTPRGTDEAARPRGAIRRDRVRARTGLPVSPLCSLAKLRWQRRHLAGAAARSAGSASRVGRARAGRRRVAERSLASRTGAFSLRDARWWPEALDWLGVPRASSPSRCPPARRAGSRECRPARGARRPSTVAGHDHVAAVVGAAATAKATCCTRRERRTCSSAAPRGARAAARVDAVAAGVTVGWHVIPDRGRCSAATS